MNDKHPLDRDDDDDESFERAPRKHAIERSTHRIEPNQAVLKVSVIGLIVTGAIVLLSAIAANNADMNSSFELTASTINRLATILLLVAFVGVLLAYQLPHLPKMLASMNASFDHKRTSNTANSNRFGSTNLDSELRRSNGSREFLWLLGVNIALLACLWCLGALLFALGLANAMLWLAWPINLILPGLLINMIVWNRGCLRAYAIGALPAVALTFTSSILSPFLMGGTMYTSPRGSMLNYAIPMAIGFTGVVISGLCSAGYYKILEAVSNNHPAPSITDAGEQRVAGS